MPEHEQNLKLSQDDVASASRSAVSRAGSSFIGGVAIVGVTLTPQNIAKLTRSPGGIATLGLGAGFAAISAFFKFRSKKNRKLAENLTRIKTELLLFQREYDRLKEQVLEQVDQQTLDACWRQIAKIDDFIARHTLQQQLIETLSVAAQKTPGCIKVNTQAITAIKVQAVANTNLPVEAVEEPVAPDTNYVKYANNWDKLTNEELASVKRSRNGAAISWFLAIFGAAGFQLFGLAPKAVGLTAKILTLITQPIAWVWLGASLIGSGIAGYFKYKSKERLKFKERDQQTALQLKLNELEYQRLLELNDEASVNENLLKIKRTWRHILTITHKGLRAKLQQDFILAITELKKDKKSTGFVALNKKINDFLISPAYKKFLQTQLPTEPAAQPANGLVLEEKKSVARSAFGRGLNWLLTGIGLPGLTLGSFSTVGKLFTTPAGGATLGLGVILAIPAAILRAISKYKKKLDDQETQVQEDLQTCEADYQRYLTIFELSASSDAEKYKQSLTTHWNNISKIDDTNMRCAEQKKFIAELNAVTVEKIVNVAEGEAPYQAIVTDINKTIANSQQKMSININPVSAEKKTEETISPARFTVEDYAAYANNWDKLTDEELASTRRSGFGAFANWSSTIFAVGGFTLTKLVIGVTGFGALLFLLSHPIGWALLGLAILGGGIAYGVKQYSKAKLKREEREKSVQNQLTANELEYKRLLNVEWENAFKEKDTKTAQKGQIQTLWDKIKQVPHPGLRAKLQTDFNRELVAVKQSDFCNAHYFSYTTQHINDFLDSTEYQQFLLKEREKQNIATYENLMAEHWSLGKTIAYPFKNLWQRLTNKQAVNQNNSLFDDMSNRKKLITVIKTLWNDINKVANLQNRVELQEAFNNKLRSFINNGVLVFEEFEGEMRSIKSELERISLANPSSTKEIQQAFIFKKIKQATVAATIAAALGLAPVNDAVANGVSYNAGGISNAVSKDLIDDRNSKPTDPSNFEDPVIADTRKNTNVNKQRTAKDKDDETVNKDNSASPGTYGSREAAFSYYKNRSSFFAEKTPPQLGISNLVQAEQADLRSEAATTYDYGSSYH